MSDPATEENVEFTDRVTGGGAAARHPDPNADFPPLVVAPSEGSDFNKLAAAIIPLACWRVDDIRFQFGSSFVGPDVSAEMAELAALIKAHPKAPLSVFGHADPVNTDDFNKILSGRRAAAIYGLLTRDTALWEDIYSNKGEHTSTSQSDRWGLASVQVMLDALGYAPGVPTGQMNGATRAAVQKFQEDNAPLTVDGDPGPKTREKLFLAYMDSLCGDDLKLEKSVFLAQGADADGKGDFQGCSEFNPVLVFSKEEDKAYQQAPDKSERNQENAPNRRVIIFLFRRGSRVDPAKWPCPKAKEGVGSCKKRLWLNGEERRSPQDERRKYSETKDTFACRFYDRMANASPCEAPRPPVKLATIEVECFVYVTPVCGAQYRVGLDGQSLISLPADGLSETKPGKRTYPGIAQPHQSLNGKQITVDSDRKGVLKESGREPLGKEMSFDAVEPRDDYYPTEELFLIPTVVQSDEQFQQARSTPAAHLKDTERNNESNIQEVVIQWDPAGSQITRCAIDAQLMPVEVLSDGKES